jgi:hypothetical protein
MYGVIDESFFSLRHPRMADTACDTMEEAFSLARGMLEDGVERVAICTCFSRGEHWYEKYTLILLEGTEAYRNHLDGEDEVQAQGGVR